MIYDLFEPIFHLFWPWKDSKGQYDGSYKCFFLFIVPACICVSITALDWWKSSTGFNKLSTESLIEVKLILIKLTLNCWSTWGSSESLKVIRLSHYYALYTLSPSYRRCSHGNEMVSLTVNRHTCRWCCWLIGHWNCEWDEVPIVSLNCECMDVCVIFVNG